MTSPLERLPAEVFDSIAASLDLPHYQSLRLTSQRLHLLTLSTFTNKYFSSLSTTLGPASLHRLLDVASHAHLCKSVTTLDIRLLSHRDYKHLAKIASIGLFPPPKRFPKLSSMTPEDIVRESTLYDDVRANRQAKCITDPLARRLLAFDNLKAIRVRTHRIEPLEWKAIAVPEGDDVFRSRCLRAVLDAIVKSGIALETFSMAKEKRMGVLTKCADVSYPAFQLPPEYLQRLSPCLQSLQTLTLSIVSQHRDHHRLPGWENGLSRFIALAPQLRHLTLSLDREFQLSPHGACILRSLSDALHLHRLETLQLSHTTFHESDLAKLIKTHADTLQRLALTNASMLTGHWFALIASFKAAHRLRYLRLAAVAGAGCPVLCRRRIRKEGWKMTLQAREQGPGMSELLDKLGRTCVSVPVSMDM